MTHHSFGQFLKWLLIAVVFIALWFGVSAVREARAAIPGELPCVCCSGTARAN